KAGALNLVLAPVAKRALLHGHCHQKSFAAMGAVEAVLKLVPDLAVETVDSSCCGMAGGLRVRRRPQRRSRDEGGGSAPPPPCAKPRPTRSSSPTAPHAVIRSRTAAGAMLSTSRACWR